MNMSVQDEISLAGKSVVITGATSGIGLKAVELFVQSGAFVIGIGRSESRIQKAIKTIKNSKENGQAIFLMADLAQQEQVRALGKEIPEVLAKHGYSNLDVLINNAGVYLERKRLTVDQIEMTFAVNHLAPFLLTQNLYPWLVLSNAARVLTVSSYSHWGTPLNLNKITNPYPYIGLLAYKRSKLCNVLFTYELNRLQLKVLAFAVDPGLVNTDIASKGELGLSAWVWKRRRKKGTSTEVPVRTLLYLAGETQIDTFMSYYFRDSVGHIPSRNARRETLSKKLWALSCKLTGVDEHNWHEEFTA